MAEFSQLVAWSDYAKLLLGLFAVSTPLAAVPIYLSLTEGLSHTDRLRVAYVVAVAYVVTLVAFTLTGEALLGFFGITLPAFKVAGGLLLMVSAFRMLAVKSSAGAEPVADGERSAVSIAVVPLAIPILAGPGAITTVMIFAHDHASWLHDLFMASVILVIAVVTWFLLRAALAMGPLLGPAAVGIVHQVMALVVASIGAEFLLEGVAEFLV
jgi:multiple antibiotic resistance protein